MEPIAMRPAFVKLLNGLRAVAAVALLLFVVLLEDCSLWFVPCKLSRLDVWTFKARCAEIKPGMSRYQTLETIHHGVLPWLENEFEEPPPADGGARRQGIEFYGTGGTCRVWLDATGQSVTRSIFEGPGPMTVNQ